MKNYPVVEVITKTGKKLHAFENDSITTAIRSRGEYDGNTLDSIRDILALIHPETSLDVGANIGNHTMVLAEHSKNVIAFEPVPFIFELLQRNIDINHFRNASAINAGLSDESVDRNIFIPDFGNLGCSSLEAMDADVTEVAIKTLIGDDFLQLNHPEKRIDFIKMDVEGHESAALEGLKQTIKKFQPLLLIEYRNDMTLKMFNETDIFERVFAGYKVFSLSSTTSKKVYARNMMGFIKRLSAKAFNKRWCLSSFNRSERYSNIYLVPPRYQNEFAAFDFLARKTRSEILS